MEQYLENKTCDTLVRLKQQVIVQKNKEIQTLKQNFELAEQRNKIKSDALESFKNLSLKQQKQIKKEKRKKEFFKIGFFAVTLTAIIETIILLIR